MSNAAAISTSTQQANAPRLTSKGLTILLVAMCLVPITTIAVLTWYLPPVYEGELLVSISAEDLPAGSFYEAHHTERPKVPHGTLVIRNDSDAEWTNMNIVINKHYQIHEHRPLGSGETRRFRTDRFVTRTGARFDLRYNPLRHVRVYARRPTRDRATYATDFAWQDVDQDVD